MNGASTSSTATKQQLLRYFESPSIGIPQERRGGGEREGGEEEDEGRGMEKGGGERGAHFLVHDSHHIAA